MPEKFDRDRLREFVQALDRGEIVLDYTKPEKRKPLSPEAQAAFKARMDERIAEIRDSREGGESQGEGE